MRTAFLLPALAVLAASFHMAQAQTTQRISKFFPTPVAVKVLAHNGTASGLSSGVKSSFLSAMSCLQVTGLGVFEQTPSFGVRATQRYPHRT